MNFTDDEKMDVSILQSKGGGIQQNKSNIHSGNLT